jgi:hypothetical protein
MAIVIRRLEEHDEVENFDCGDEALNNYLKLHAWTNQQKSSIGVGYVALDEDAPRTVRVFSPAAPEAVVVLSPIPALYRLGACFGGVDN